MKFGNIPIDILEIELPSTDEEFVKLRDLIIDATDQDIEESKFIVTPDKYDSEKYAIESFQAYTKDHVLILSYIYPVGFHLHRMSRHYAK